MPGYGRLIIRGKLNANDAATLLERLRLVETHRESKRCQIKDLQANFGMIESKIVLYRYVSLS